MSKELSCNVGDLLMLEVILDGIIVINWINFSQFHKIYTDAVISESLSVDITNSSADLEEFLILGYSLLEFTEVVEEYTSAVIGSTFIS